MHAFASNQNNKLLIKSMWAILSGIEGNMAAYDAVLADIKCQRVKVEALYILGDIVAANPDSEHEL